MKSMNNESGISVQELLAAIAVIGFVLTVVFYFVSNTNSNLDNIATREQILSESRTIMKHLTTEIRKGRVDASSDPSTYILMLDGYEYQIVDNAKVKADTSNDVYYRFDEQTHTLSYTKNPAAAGMQTLSTHVKDIKIELSENNKRVEIELTMQLPNDQSYTTSTVLYVPQLD